MEAEDAPAEEAGEEGKAAGALDAADKEGG